MSAHSSVVLKKGLSSAEMRTDLYEEMYNQERSYWWHLAKRTAVLSLIDAYWSRNVSQGKVADLGCGTGFMLECLKKYGSPIGVDSSPMALKFCRQRGHINLYQFDISSKPWPFEDGSLDIITALDVLEHIDNDQDVILEAARSLKRHGILVITVPAFQCLWSYWDEMLGHKRRYTIEGLSSIVKKAPFSLKKISYRNTFIFPVAAGVRFFKGLQSGRRDSMESDFMPVPSLVNNLLVKIHQLESGILKCINLPFGLSIICLAMKQQTELHP